LIEGYVEGEIEVSGDVTVEASGLVGAPVSARSIVVRGAVRGDLSGQDVIRLEEGARVVGDLRAPRIAIARGGLVRGLVQTGDHAAQPRAAKAQAARAATPPPAQRRAPQPVVATPAKPVPVPARPAPVVHQAAVAASAPKPPPEPAAQAPAPPGPPPPVVPALRKGAKAALKKKA
jgi:hypothetical protein